MNGIVVIRHLVSYTCLFGTYKQLPSPSWHLMPPPVMLLTLLYFHSLSTWFPHPLHVDLSMCLSFHSSVFFSPSFSVCSSSCLSPPHLPDLRNPLHFFNLANYSSSSKFSLCQLFFFLLHRPVICDCPPAPTPTPFHCAYFLHFPLFFAAVQNRARAVCQM